MENGKLGIKSVVLLGQVKEVLRKNGRGVILGCLLNFSLKIIQQLNQSSVCLGKLTKVLKTFNRKIYSDLVGFSQNGSDSCMGVLNKWAGVSLEFNGFLWVE